MSHSRLIEPCGDGCRTSGAHPQTIKRRRGEGQDQFGPRKTSKFFKKLLSARIQNKSLKISNRSVRRMINFDLKIYPYKIQFVQELTENCLANRWSGFGKFFDSSIPNQMLLL